jgi:hypothetical protein
MLSVRPESIVEIPDNRCGKLIMFIVALIATVLVFVQNLVMFGFGMKEMAIYSSPLFFTGIFLCEIAAIWTGYVCARRFLRRRRLLALGAWVIVVLISAEVALPASFFRIWVQHEGRQRMLNRIELAGTSFEALASDRGGSRFALTYTLKFPKTGHYLTFPASIGPWENQVSGNYFTKEHPEYHDENYVFEAGRPYSFTVVFDTEGKKVDFSTEEASIDICTSKDYFMACRVIAIGLGGVPAALAANPAPVLREPAVAADNVRDITEKSIRLDELSLKSTAYRAGAPVEFSFVITNAGKITVAIPGGNFDKVIMINYGWEAVSDSAKTTKVQPGRMHIGSAVINGLAPFMGARKGSLTPGEKVPYDDKIIPFEPLAPGAYKLHVYLFSRYSTESNRPVQELVQDFSIVP